MATENSTSLGPPPLQTPITAQGPDNFGVRFEDRDVPAGNLNTGWAQWFYAAFSKITGALASIISIEAAATALSATVTALSATVTALSTAFTAFQTTGTFTPVLAFGGASTGITYSIQSGQYCKVGNLVTVKLTILLTSKGSSTGAATISGLPFTANASGFTFGGSFGFISAMSGIVHPYPGLSQNTTVLDLRDSNTGTNSNLTDANFTNAANVQITMTYFT